MHRLVQIRKYSPSFIGKIVVSYRFMSKWKAFTPMIDYVMMGGAQLLDCIIPVRHRHAEQTMGVVLSKAPNLAKIAHAWRDDTLL